MGIRIHNSTWRRPLRTLDCWLPASGASPSTWSQGLQHGRRWLNLLRQAWLSKHVQDATQACPAPAQDPRHPCMVTPRAPATAIKLRVTQSDDLPGRGAGRTRLVISGRMADVCAELDRLAALEAHRLPQGS